jgi:ferritin-like protein
MGSENLHEREDLLSDETKNMHRAIVSLMEELEAVDWYNQRAEGCTDEDLRAILTHNKNEEIEHAMMTLEWLRRNNPVFDTNIRTYLLSQGPITEVEAAAEGNGGNGGGDDSGEEREAPARAARTNDGSLGIGSLRRK